MADEVLHLMRESHDGEAERGAAWCGAACGQPLPDYERDPSKWLHATDEIPKATCRDCLDDARAFGERCRQRAERLRRGLPEPT